MRGTLPGRVVDVLSRLGKAEVWLLVVGFLMVAAGVGRFISRPRSFTVVDLLLCGLWLLLGLVVALSLAYVLQHGRWVFYMLSVVLCVFAFAYPHFGVGTGVALLILVGAEAAR